MYRCAVIGDGQSVMGFRALGLTAVVCGDGQSAASALHKLAREKYAIVYITEQLAVQIETDIDRYKDTPDVAVIPIPGVSGSLGLGDRQLHSAVERAVGADILKNT